MAVTEAVELVDLYGAGAELEHGWSPSTPLEDSLIRRAVLAVAESTATPAGSMGARVTRTADLIAADLGRPAGFWNSATVIRPLGPVGWDHALAELDEFFAITQAMATVELLSPFPTPDLRPMGWTLGGHPPAMWLPPGPPRQQAHSRVDVRVVTEPAEIEEWGACAAEWYPTPGTGRDLVTASLLDSPDVRLFTGRLEGLPVAVSSNVVAHGTNAIPLVATHPDARGRGFGAAVTWAAARFRPELPSVLLASDHGRPLYQRMGYVPLSRWTLWTRSDQETGSRPRNGEHAT